MKYFLILNLLLINSACSGMAFLKTLKKKVEMTFASNHAKNSKSEQPVEQEDSSTLSGQFNALDKILNQGQENIQKERLALYQYTQRHNINGVILPLLVAGVCKFNANQSYPGGDAYFNYTAATWFSLGVSATFVYKFCTTPMPFQSLSIKNK